MPVPYIESGEGHFSSLSRPSLPLDRSTYISDEALLTLQTRMREWTTQAITGSVPYASSSEPFVSSRQHVL